ncbi:MAG: hypothetical protein U9R46_11330 [Bacteroidota bacterium]|nr:hypothetical protein [Bacteroidota bacterium]
MVKAKDEITIKELILFFKSWLGFFYRKKIVIFSVSFASAVIGFFYAKSLEIEYSAKTNFVLSTENKSGNIISAVSQFGLDLGSGGGGDVFSGDNIIMLFKSRLMVQKALMQKSVSNNETLLNYYIRKSRFSKLISNNARLSKSFPFPDDINNKFSLIQDSLLRIIHATIVKENLTVGKPDKKNSLYEVEVKSNDEFFSYNLVNNIVNQTINFYIETKTKVARENVTMLSNAADSLRNILGSVVLGSADITDRTFNLNPAYQKNRADVTTRQTRLPIIISSLGEVEKSLMQARLSLQKETPLLQIIDRASLPLFIVQKSKKNYALYGALLGLVGALAGLIILKIVKDGLER